MPAPSEHGGVASAPRTATLPVLVLPVFPPVLLSRFSRRNRPALGQTVSWQQIAERHLPPRHHGPAFPQHPGTDVSDGPAPLFSPRKRAVGAHLGVRGAWGTPWSGLAPWEAQQPRRQEGSPGGCVSRGLVPVPKPLLPAARFRIGLTRAGESHGDAVEEEEEAEGEEGPEIPSPAHPATRSGPHGAGRGRSHPGIWARSPASRCLGPVPLPVRTWEELAGCPHGAPVLRKGRGRKEDGARAAVPTSGGAGWGLAPSPPPPWATPPLFTGCPRAPRIFARRGSPPRVGCLQKCPQPRSNAKT